jgi:hypothetical protein
MSVITTVTDREDSGVHIVRTLPAARISATIELADRARLKESTVDAPYTGWWDYYGGDWHWVLGAPSAGSKGNTDWNTRPDNSHNPASDPNYQPPPADHQHPAYGGYWSPEHGGGWSWHPGTPPPALADKYGWDKITDGTKTPNGAPNPDYDPHPAPKDVAPPTVTQPWGDHPPSVTGNPLNGDPSGGSGTPITQPPHHPPYRVRPGQVRYAEVEILNQTQNAVSEYDGLKSAVGDSKSWNWGYGQELTHLDVNGKVDSIQDSMLLAVADTLDLAGQYVRALNNAAQYYAKADIESFVPEE